MQSKHDWTHNVLSEERVVFDEDGKEHTLPFGGPEWLEHMKVTKRSGLWPRERWSDSLPCIGDVCEAQPQEDSVE